MLPLLLELGELIAWHYLHIYNYLHKWYGVFILHLVVVTGAWHCIMFAKITCPYDYNYREEPFKQKLSNIKLLWLWWMYNNWASVFDGRSVQLWTGLLRHWGTLLWEWKLQQWVEWVGRDNSIDLWRICSLTFLGYGRIMVKLPYGEVPDDISMSHMANISYLYKEDKSLPSIGTYLHVHY